MWPKHKHLFLKFLEAGKFRFKELADSLSGKSSWFIHGLLCVLTWGKGEGSLLGVSFRKDTNIIHEASLSWPNPLPPPIPSHWRLGFQHMNIQSFAFCFVFHPYHTLAFIIRSFRDFWLSKYKPHWTDMQKLLNIYYSFVSNKWFWLQANPLARTRNIRASITDNDHFWVKKSVALIVTQILSFSSEYHAF